ncbi:hypothetical protein [Kutzneria chonburiensis]|uniref:Uncharacterized protein n=1 Tax=Kutzneria chonburiensis TaxID=1483604 RepID=A0ABV6MJS5_9PSEU|nr:hypothetical protein [Kutzneria chonburiensis]
MNWFWLDRPDGTYVQVGLGLGPDAPDGHYSLEHRDGATERHVRVFVTDLDVVAAAFRAFASGDETWRSAHTWTEV